MLPKIRSGHSLISYNNDKLILFGGIYDITWELDDCFLFDTKTNEWIVIDQDQARKKADLGYSPLHKKSNNNSNLSPYSKAKKDIILESNLLQ